MIVYRITVKATGEEAHFRKIRTLANSYHSMDISESTLYKRLRQSNHHENKFVVVERIIIKG